jgi:hypothetical protein
MVKTVRVARQGETLDLHGRSGRNLRQAVGLGNSEDRVGARAAGPALPAHIPFEDDLRRNEFVVMLYPEPYVGTLYEIAEGNRPALVEAWRGTPSSIGIYQDSFGIFISGLAPVLRADGKPVAVIEVDKEIDEFLAQARALDED